MAEGTSEPDFLDGIFGFVDQVLDGTSKALGVDTVPPAGTPSHVAPEVAHVVEVKAAPVRSPYTLVDAIDGETGEETWIVASTGDDRAVCSSERFARLVLSALEAREAGRRP